MKNLQIVINQKLIRKKRSFTDGLYTFINLFSYLKIRKSRLDLSGFDHIGFDGIVMCLLWRFLYGIRAERTSFDFTSFAAELFEELDKNAKTLYVIGSRDDEIDRFIKKVQNKYTQIAVAGHRNGYFSNKQDRQEAIHEILLINPDVVVAGMGTVNQEQYLLDLKKSGWKGNGFTCGGLIHQTAGHGLQYYPKILNTLNLRWLFRIFDEPKLFTRYAFLYPLSVVFILFDFLELKCQKPKISA